MPEFQLQYGTEDAGKRFEALDDFTKGYIEAMFFTDMSDPDDGDLQNATVHDLAPEAWKKILADCGEFGEMARIDAIWEGGWSAIKSKKDEGLVSHHAGRDFWYTRNGHGCGFWDGDWPEPYSTALTTVAKKFGSVSPYRGDDGKIYLM